MDIIRYGWSSIAQVLVSFQDDYRLLPFSAPGSRAEVFDARPGVLLLMHRAEVEQHQLFERCWSNVNSNEALNPQQCVSLPSLRTKNCTTTPALELQNHTTGNAI
eukprot:1530912-Amphidinium_carterae.1